ncbi:MAG: sugar phosphate isomerase/epimerase [Oscillospiraceae bacterium]|jgi:fatty-acyl-CoA synthase|nr:sugar phosphate isomerase/epimerase [Oscillospiraceae bacterium]
MKLSFSTVGCPRWQWSDIVSAATDLGYAGIEVRGVGDDLFLPDARVFSADSLPKTRAELERRGLTVPCLASDVHLHDPAQDVKAVLGRYTALAKGLNTRGIRVLGDYWGKPGEGIDTDLVAARLKELAPLAEDAGVELWVESNGVYADTAKLKALIEYAASPAVGVVWDINHPVRFFGESVAQTVSNIGKYIRHTHIKDSDMADGVLTYKMLGYGSLPVEEALSALASLGYTGFLSMEWIKRWNDELEDAGVVFSHFAFQMRRYLSRLA